MRTWLVAERHLIASLGEANRCDGKRQQCCIANHSDPSSWSIASKSQEATCAVSALGSWALTEAVAASPAMLDPEWPSLSELALHWLIA